LIIHSAYVSSRYFDPLLIRELRSNIKSILQENAQNLLLCPCTSSKILHGTYGAPSGPLQGPSGATITSPVYSASQVSPSNALAHVIEPSHASCQYQAISEPRKPSFNTIVVEFCASQQVRYSVHRIVIIASSLCCVSCSELC
jgi:hypothetical protein